MTNIPTYTHSICRFALVEFEDADAARKAFMAIDNMQLDKNHKLRATLHDSIAAHMEAPDVFVPEVSHHASVWRVCGVLVLSPRLVQPEDQHGLKGDLQSFLLDYHSRSQYVVRYQVDCTERRVSA